MKKLICAWLMIASAAVAISKPIVKDGTVEIQSSQLRSGVSYDLAGKWLYKPGYAVTQNEAPEKVGDHKGFIPVPVPQLLNRIRWWLDDSDDFNRYETNRLAKLGFDTDRAEDGWYHLWVDLPSLRPEANIAIEFEGVAMRSKTYCNGALLGSHDGMFSRFSYDLTPHLKPGKNLIAVFVSMEKIPASSLSMGEAVTVNLTASKVKSLSKGMYGPLSPNFDNRAYDLHGIWQPVRLVVRSDAKLDDVWFSPSLTGADVRVEARSLGQGSEAFLKAKWTDAKTGKVFAKLSPQKIQLGTSAVTQTLALRDVKPKLWTPAEPNLYNLEVTLESKDGKVLDSWSHQVGFRTFQVVGNQFLLNGKPYWLRGGNHLPYGKNPFDPALARKLIQSLHDANVRVTRTHATPWNEAWLDAADEIGLGVSLEGIRPWALAGKIGPTPPECFAHWLMENEDVVKRARNHPSVFIYTVGNEMMLRDSKSLEKWQQLSDVVKQTRQLDPTRPVICSSEYSRDAELYNELLKPNGIDDGDADDLHKYNNWYGPSSFVTDAKLEKEVKENGGRRPLLGQEMSTGYPDLDTGLPVLRYTRDLVTPQAWVGNYAYPGNDSKYFLEHHRAVTKRWAERLRFERGNQTAGFMLFATECWFSHSYDAKTVRPYPVVEAIREAFSPVGTAIETSRRRFFAGEELETGVFVTNDDEDARDYSNLEVSVSFIDRTSKRVLSSKTLGQIEDLPYLSTKRVPVRISMPNVDSRNLAMRLQVSKGKQLISRTTDPIELLAKVKPIVIEAAIFKRTLGPEVSAFLKSNVQSREVENETDANVLLLGQEDTWAGLGKGGKVREAIEKGATAVVFSPGEKFVKMFSSEIMDVKNAPGEYADFSPCAGTRLADQLAPMDLKWWGRKDDWRVFTANSSHRLKTGGTARELIRYIPAHSYISEDKKAEQYRTVFFEIPMGRGRLWICDLHLEASIAADPVAQRFALNLIGAASDPDSTKKLPKVPSHDELLKGKK